MVAAFKTASGAGKYNFRHGWSLD